RRRHEPAAFEAFEAGRHVRLEKPMATTIESCDRILAAAAAAGTVFLLAENAQYWPAVTRTKDLLDDGAIGELVTARAWCSTALFPLFYHQDSWRHSTAAAGGGGVIDAGPHFLRPPRVWWRGLLEAGAAPPH